MRRKSASKGLAGNRALSKREWAKTCA